MIACPVRASMADVGSSATSKRERWTSARAIATRCCCPPESCDGKDVMRSPSPTLFSISVARAIAMDLASPSMTSGTATFSAAVWAGGRLNC